MNTNLPFVGSSHLVANVSKMRILAVVYETESHVCMTAAAAVFVMQKKLANWKNWHNVKYESQNRLITSSKWIQRFPLSRLPITFYN